jgi:diguanylate cyclase (GGDEF)-like protein
MSAELSIAADGSHDDPIDCLSYGASQQLFAARGEEALRRFQERGRRFGVMMLNLDNFSAIADARGQEPAADVLVAVSRILHRQLRSHEDLAARIAVDRFAMLFCGDLDEPSLVQIADGIRAEIAKAVIPHEAGPIHVTASLGVALVSAKDAGWDSVEMRADAALYRANATGTHQVLVAKAP